MIIKIAKVWALLELVFISIEVDPMRKEMYGIAYVVFV
jgi:hypothetical protein